MGKKNKATKNQSQQQQEASHVPQTAASQRIALDSIDERQLCALFDTHISTESTIPEEGIQAARDMYIDVVKYENIARKRTQYLLSKKEAIITQICALKEQNTKEIEQCDRFRMQNDKLHALSDELTRKKDEAAANGHARLQQQRYLRQEKSQTFITNIRTISNELEEHGRAHLKQAEENDELRDSLRLCLERYHEQETAFEKTMELQNKKLEILKLRQEDGIVNLEKEKTNGNIESLNGEIGVVQKQCDKEIENKNRELLEKENRLNLRDACSN
jgi:hypothetical protein